MNRLLQILCLSLSISYAYGGNYKVLFLNDATLQYTNGKKVKVGDIFKEATDISWKKDKQAVKAIDTKTKKQIIFLGKEWARKGGLGALTAQKHLSTHDAAGLPADQINPIENIFDEEYLLLDPIEVPVDKSIDLKNHHFEASYSYGDTRLIKTLKQRDDTVILDKTIFEVDGEKLEPRDITIKIDYVDNETNLPVVAGDKIQVIFIPEVLD